MNELLAAAKAVIEVWDAGRGVWDQINALRDAVERAEKQEPIGFKRWCQLNAIFAPNYVQWFESAWTAAQQALQPQLCELKAENLTLRKALKLYVEQFGELPTEGNETLSVVQDLIKDI